MGSRRSMVHLIHGLPHRAGRVPICLVGGDLGPTATALPCTGMWTAARRRFRPLAALALVCCLSAPAGAEPARRQTERKFALSELRNYALSSCLRQAFPAIADEADAAKDVYLQNGKHPGETYMAIQTMAATWLQRDYPSFRDVKLSIVKCIDFADSPAVASLARRTLPAG